MLNGFGDPGEIDRLRTRIASDYGVSVHYQDTNLTAPEVAPVARPAAANPPPQAPAVKKIDGRSARKTNRTVQFATRVTPEWDARIRAAKSIATSA